MMASELQVADEQHRLTEPSLTPALKSLLDRASEPQSTSDGPRSYIISDWALPSMNDCVPRIPAEGREQVATALAHYERHLKPAPQGKITARVTVLLSHYFVPDLPVAAQRAVLTDWVDALADFPWWAIQKACAEWLKTERRKPTPADIVLRCEAAISKAGVDVWALKKLLKANPVEGPAQHTRGCPDPVRVSCDE